MKRIIAIILTMAIALSTPIYTNAKVYEGSLLTKFNPISTPFLNFGLIKQYRGDKIVIYNSENIDNSYGRYKYGLINLNGEVLLDTKYDYIYIDNNGDIEVSYLWENRTDIYDKHMVLIDSVKCKKTDAHFEFQKYSDHLSDYTKFRGYTLITSEDGEQRDFGIIEIYNEISDEIIKTISFSVDDRPFFNMDVLRYCKEIKAFDCITTPGADPGREDYFHLSCYDFNGNDVFKNDLGVKAYAYIGDGYYFYEDDLYHQKGIAILPGFKKKKVAKILRKPAKTKIKKIAKKKKSSKRLKVSLKKIKKVSGYNIKVYSSKKLAKKNKKAILSKRTKKATITIKSKKLAYKKSLYVKARTYNKLYGNYKYSKWTSNKKVKIK